MQALHQLLAWTSPSYPVGAFSYSHGLEWAVECGEVRDVSTLVAYVRTVLRQGGGWLDAVLFAHAWRAAGDAAVSPSARGDRRCGPAAPQ